MADLSKARVQTVREHMARDDWDGVIATFVHPRYDLLGSGAVFDGEAGVRRKFAASRVPFPDQGNEIITIAASGDTVLVELADGDASGAASGWRAHNRAHAKEIPRADGCLIRGRARFARKLDGDDIGATEETT